jgi:hypothetical protein
MSFTAPLSLFDDETLIPLIKTQHLQRDLLHFRQLRKFHDLVAVKFHLAVFRIMVLFPNRHTTLQRDFMLDAHDFALGDALGWNQMEFAFPDFFRNDNRVVRACSSAVRAGDS